MTTAVPFVFNGRRSIAAMLKDIDSVSDDATIINCLRIMPQSVKPVLMGMFHPDVKWALPEGVPPYRKSEVDVPAMLHQEARRLYLFWEGGNPNLKPARREQLFINLLESLNQDDAELILAAKDKRNVFTNITGWHVAQAWPDQALLAAYPEKVPSKQQKAKKRHDAEAVVK